MIRSASLIYAVFISLIIALIGSSFIFSSYFNKLHIAETVALNNMRTDNMSGIRFLLSNQQEIKPNETVYKELFNDSNHVIELSRKNWGVYEVLVSHSKWKNHSESKIALAGNNAMKREGIALYMADANKPLAICGTTKIKGNCYLPKSGVKRAYIEGQNYQGNELIYGQVKNSQPHLPKLNEELVEASTIYLESGEMPGDSMVHFNDLLNTDTIINPFTNRTLLIFASGTVSLSGIHLEGNIVVYSGKRIIFGNNSSTTDILACAPEIFISEGFKGSLQLFASDTIVVNKNCSLNYPSSLSLINSKKREKDFSIVIKENVTIEGAIFIHNKFYNRKSAAYLIIEPGALVKGQVYCSDYVQLKGSIHGSLYCKKFVLKTPSSVYENHILSGEIDYSQLSTHFVGISLVEAEGTKKIVKWLN